MKIIEGGILPILSWCENPDKNCIEQAINLANHPAAIHKICLMPDAHMGFGMPIGGVMATKNAIIPNAVGVDIGCGMRAVRINRSKKDFKKELLEKIAEKIYEEIPMGMRRREERCDASMLPGGHGYCHVIDIEYDNARRQIGTLGGGNHFIEIQTDEKENIWIMIHTGSRNIGKKVGDYFNEKAKELNKRWHYENIVKQDLAFLPIGETTTKEYIAGMRFCIDFAYINRNEIERKVINIISTEIGKIEIMERIDTIHNYATEEIEYKPDTSNTIFTHRKGAILAQKGTPLIIPGSQGTCSYIAHGLENKDALSSASHGAGRIMGRKEAMRILSYETEAKKLNDAGIIHRMNSTEDLDEAPGAYKNIDEVMAAQKDLVEIRAKLTPIVAIKG